MARQAPTKPNVIPRSFQLAGHKVTVKIVPEKDWSDDETVGFWNSENLTISVPMGLDDQRTQQVFCHELVHAILHTMGENRLNGNEKFVDLFASLLHQVWVSIK